MAQVLYFSRDTKMYVEIDSAVWEIPVLDGFSFSQGANSTEVVLSEAESSAGVSKRGRRVFNDSLAPAEWSFSTYARPFLSAGSGAGAADNAAKQHAVEEVLWAMMAGPATYQSNAFTNTTTHGAGASADLSIDFDQSNKSQLGTANIYFSLDDGGSHPTVYKLTGAVVNEASIDFDIEGIATINWSGFASTITSVNKPTKTIYEAINATNNYIRNRLTQLEITAADTTTFPGAGSGVYNLTLTGGNITISNNMTFLTPETIGSVNTPLGHVTGARSVSGNFTCYLSFETSGGNVGTSTDFFADMKSAAALAKTVNSFQTIFKIGGGTSPFLKFTMPTAHFEIPAHNIEDVIALETTFQALPSTIGNTDEVTLAYRGVAPA